MKRKKILDERLSGPLPWLLAAALALPPALALRAPSSGPAAAVRAFAELPVQAGGRVKPLDSVARSSLLMLSGRQSADDGGRRLTASEWLADAMFRPAVADGYRVFLVDDPDVLGLLGLRQTEQRRLSFEQLRPKLQELETQAAAAGQVKAGARSRFQTAAVSLESRVELYQGLQNSLQLAEAQSVSEGLSWLDAGRVNKADRAALTDQFRFLDRAAAFRALPDELGLDWQTMGAAVLVRLQGGPLHPGAGAYARLADAYRAGDAAAFAAAAEEVHAWFRTHLPADEARARRETAFNDLDPFYRGALLYVAAFLLVCASWLAWPRTLYRCGWAALAWGFALHTGGLAARMWLQGRPPVTNLYSSALFVGWTSALLALILERVTRRGVAALTGSAIASATLVVALHLDSQGDTMEMMRAVLDSNFWLATHVTTITIGYGSTFLSGFLAAAYLLQARFFPRRAGESGPALEKMVFGVVCFSTFFSFLGTILGGVWADQSWGRFWGWDPKENGALMIVLWNAAMLHARWGRAVGARGFMAMAVLGNVVTALSWFGVNMLGVGLHSYGFMDQASRWLAAFVAAQLALVAVGLSRPPAKGASASGACP